MNDYVDALIVLADERGIAGHNLIGSPDERRAVIDTLLSSVGQPPVAMAPSTSVNDEFAALQSAQTVRQRFWRVLALWNPIFYTRQELERVFGPPTSFDGQWLQYELDEGETASRWRFRLVGEHVYGFELIPGR